MPKIKIISVDFQKEFTMRGGTWFKHRPSVNFVKNILIPFLVKNNIKIAEIISDYRKPCSAVRGDGLHPGEDGFVSEIPNNIKLKNAWIKCMHSPIWTRKNIGSPNKKPGIPYQDPEKFTKWLHSVIGKPENVSEVILFGLTLDCCLLCTAQELMWRGYKVKILKEATDSYSGNPQEKKTILNNPPLLIWSKTISWSELKRKLSGH